MRPGGGQRLARALLGARGAIPREGRLLAARRRRTAHRSPLSSSGALLARLGDPRQALGAQQQAQQRARVAPDRAAHRAGQLGAQRRVEVAGEQDVEHAVLVEAHLQAVAAGGVDLPADRLAPDPVHEVEEVVADARGDAVARAGAAQLAQRAGHRLEGRDVQDVGALGRHDGVQHERLDVGRVLGGVVERDLGAVGDAEEDELLIAGLDAQRLDVVDRVRGAVEAARRARAGSRTPRRHRRSTRRPARRPGSVSRPELPVPRWSKTSRSRVASAGPRIDANSVATGIAAWPGPPASATTAVAVGLLEATTRLTFSVTVPGTAPVRSSGTASWPHWKPGGLARRVRDGGVGARCEGEGGDGRGQGGEGGPGAHGRAG